MKMTDRNLVSALTGLLMLVLSGPPIHLGYAQVPFEEILVDSLGPIDPWGKAVGDVNGDGRPDLVVGGHDSGGLVFYANPSWTRHAIDANGAFGTDLEVHDLNGDGEVDIAAITADERLVWYEGPHWAAHQVADERLHDIELEDFDGDGDLDIVGRNQGEFGQSGATLFFYEQKTPASWKRTTLPIPAGEGLAIADVDRDGDLDIVVNESWYENTGQPGGWIEHTYVPGWHPNTFIAIGDVNGDARVDFLASPSELAGDRFRISWFEAPTDPASGDWVEHVIDPDVETVYHFIGAADFDLDGDLDVATAEMHQSADPDLVKLYLNHGDGAEWTAQILSRNGSHSMRIADVDADGDPDLFGANWRGREVKLWMNLTAERGR